MKLSLSKLMPLGLLFCAACGGATSFDTSDFQNYTSFTTALAVGDALTNTVSAIPYTNPRALPSSGSATYVGIAGAEITNFTLAVGEIGLVADFSESKISGVMGNFLDEDSTPLLGEINVVAGDIDRNTNVAAAYTYETTISGELTYGSDVFVIEGVLIGDFTGTDHTYVEGFWGGPATSGGVENFISGAFFAER